MTCDQISVRAYPWILHVIGPTVVGAGIYLAFRTETLWVFTWLDTVGLTPAVQAFRSSVQYVATHVPEWVLYSVPDGLWVYAVTAAMVLIWRDEPHTWQRNLWIGSGVVLSLGGELGQWLKWVPGTFDVWDLVAYVVGFLVPLCVLFSER